MSGEVIKEFLVGLGWDIDEKGMKQFDDSIKTAAKRVTLLYGTIKVAAAGIFYGISRISESFEQMGYEMRLIAPTINKTLLLRQELLKAYSAAGINLKQAVVNSVKFNLSLTKTQYALQAIYKSTASKFFPVLTKQMDIFRKNLTANMPKIIASLEKFVNFVFKAFEATVLLGQRVWSILSRIYDFFVFLHKATDGWSTIIMGVVAAWKILNLTFLATPLGKLLLGLTAILVLWDDFQVWREGGKSLFDWTSFVPVIDAVASSLEFVRNILDGFFTILFNIGGLIYDVFTLNFVGGVDKAKEALNGLIQILKNAWEGIKSLGRIGGALGGWAAQFLGGEASQPTQDQLNRFGQINNPQPLGGNVANQQQTNQNVNQQTSIIVQGSADAGQVGKQVASEQSKVNFDMVRNLKGAAR